METKYLHDKKPVRIVELCVIEEDWLAMPLISQVKIVYPNGDDSYVKYNELTKLRESVPFTGRASL